MASSNSLSRFPTAVYSFIGKREARDVPSQKQPIKSTKLPGALGAILLLYAFPNNPVVKFITDFLPKIKG